MRLWAKRSLFLFALLVVLSGCSSGGANDENSGAAQPVSEEENNLEGEQGKNPVDPAGKGGNNETPTSSHPSSETPTDDWASPSLTEPIVRELVKEAHNRFVHVMIGGNMHGTIETFTHEGTEYRYLGEDLATKEQLTAYLQKTYSERAVQEILTKYRFIEHNGRMAQPNADGGTMLRWDDTQPQLINGNEHEKLFELKVPYGEGDAVEFEVKQVKCVFVEGAGWRIDHELN